MEVDENVDSNLTKIKDSLNQNKIKLWLSPYYSVTEGSNEDEIKNLANSFSCQLGISYDKCLECLQLLQTKALKNISDRNNFQKTGVAVLKVRIPNKANQGKILNVSIELKKSGKILKELISTELSVPMERLKIIFHGKIINDEETLINQELKHGAHLMALTLTSITDLSKAENHVQVLDSTKADIKLLSENESGEDYLQVADQTGKLLYIPDNEKKTLILSMTLHERGRIAMKDGDFSLALVMLLEAEKELSSCNSALLKTVDNHGILNLDIVWCYLNLQSVTQLPDAEERLKLCELNFSQTYGPNLERLIMLKGSSENEIVLFMRLHLLQGVIFYHQNKINEALEVITKAEYELKFLEVDDLKLSQLMELGYGTTEARLALREARGDLKAAVNIIEKKRIVRKKNEENEEKERKLMRAKKKLGKCVNNEWIDPQFHKALVSMGYSYKLAKWALAQSCNDISESITLIQEHPEYLSVNSGKIIDSAAKGVGSIEFKLNKTKNESKKFEADSSEAFEEINNEDAMNYSDSSSESVSSEPSTSTQKCKEAFTRVSKGVPKCEEDYLDLNLIAETAFLKKYKDLLQDKVKNF